MSRGKKAVTFLKKVTKKLLSNESKELQTPRLMESRVFLALFLPKKNFFLTSIHSRAPGTNPATWRPSARRTGDDE
jgi:hypothetical protein